MDFQTLKKCLPAIKSKHGAFPERIFVNEIGFCWRTKIRMQRRGMAQYNLNRIEITHAMTPQ